METKAIKTNKNTWREVYKSDFLASWDLDEKNEILTISECASEMCKLSRGNEEKVVVRFVEKKLSNGIDVKPMILNPTNSKLIHLATGTNNLNSWVGLILELGIKLNTGKIGNSQGLSILRVLKGITERVFTDEENKIITKISECKTIDELNNLYSKDLAPYIVAIFTKRKNEILKLQLNGNASN